jgi:hypothetical protein
MKVAILYRSQTEQDRMVLDFLREYQRRTGRVLTLHDVNTREGSAIATLYDIWQFPTVLALSNDGQIVQMWQGEHLPLMNEVMYYDQQSSFFAPSTSLV